MSCWCSRNRVAAGAVSRGSDAAASATLVLAMVERLRERVVGRCREKRTAEHRGRRGVLRMMVKPREDCGSAGVVAGMSARSRGAAAVDQRAVRAVQQDLT